MYALQRCTFSEMGYLPFFQAPPLDGAYQKLPGLSVHIDESKCGKGETCIGSCFVSAINIQNESAFVGDDCVGCGNCVGQCVEGAISLTMKNEEEMFKQLLDRVREISDLPLKVDQNLKSSHFLVQ